jgi:hypothetical protein
MMSVPCRIGGFLLAGTLAAGNASAQVPDRQTLTLLKPQVPIGDVVYVTDTAGMTIKGKLAAITDDVLRVKVEAGEREIATADIRQVQWRRQDSVLNGLLIGAAVGAIPGIYWLIADPNECTGLCPEDYASIALGAGIGALIDLAISKKVTVYTAASDRSRHVSVGPVISRNRKGVQLALRF